LEQPLARRERQENGKDQRREKERPRQCKQGDRAPEPGSASRQRMREHPRQHRPQGKEQAHLKKKPHAFKEGLGAHSARSKVFLISSRSSRERSPFSTSRLTRLEASPSKTRSTRSRALVSS